VGTEAVTAALELGRRLGARTVLNAAPAPPPGSLDLNALLAATDVLVVNETEAELMAGGEGEVGWAGPAARLLGLGCRSVVITLGAAGAVVAQADRPGIVAVPAPQVPYGTLCFFQCWGSGSFYPQAKIGIKTLIYCTFSVIDTVLRIRIRIRILRIQFFWAFWIRILLDRLIQLNSIQIRIRIRTAIIPK
jgi:hypothetical protein